MPALPTDGLTIQHLASWQGLMDHYDVAASPSIADGDVLAWNASAGLFEPVAQTGGGGTLASLTDTNITAPATGQTLHYDGADWINSSELIVNESPAEVRIGTALVIPNSATGSLLGRNNADTQDLALFGLDSGDNLNIGRDDGVITIQTFGAMSWYDDAASPSVWIQLSSAGFVASGIAIIGGSDPGGSEAIRATSGHFTSLSVGTTTVADSAAIIRKTGTTDAFSYSLNAITTQSGAATTAGKGPVAAYFRADVDASGLTVDRAFGAYFGSPSITGTLTEYRAINIDNITGAGTNIAISTGLGLVKFGDQVQSSVTTGTAPFTVASTTLVTNLNADLLDGNHSTAFASASHVHDTSDITTGTFADARIAASNVTQHQAALTITEGQIANGTIYTRIADAEVVTGVWQFQNGMTVGDDAVAGSFVSVVGAGVGGSLYGIRAGSEANPDAKWQIYGDTANNDLQFATNEVARGKIINTTGVLQWAYQIESTVTTGTAPFVVASTTAVTNLNADLLDGSHASAFAAAGHVHDAGDITTGTLDEQRGGTGNNAYVTGDILYASATFALSRLAKGTSGMFLKQGASIPAWASITAADVDSGTFPGTTGYTFTSLVVTNAPAAGGAGFRLPHGSAPSTPTNGDLWSTTTGLFFRQNGTTVTLASSANAVITNPSGVQTIVAASTTSTNYALELQGFGSSGAFQNDDSPPYIMRGFYWDGAVSQPIEWSVASIITGAPTPTNTLTFKADGTARFTVTDAGKGWLGGPWIVGSDDGPPVAVNTQELVAHDNTRQIGVGVDTTRGLVGMRSNHEFAFMTNNTRRWTVAAAGGMEVVADDSYDIGTTTFRVREIFTHDLRLGGPSSDVGLIYHSGEFDNGTSGAGAKTVDWTNGNVQKITATGAATITLTAPDGPTTLVLRIIANSTTAYTFTWPSTVKWAGGVSAPASPTTSGQWIMVTMYYDGTNYTASYTGNTG